MWCVTTVCVHQGIITTHHICNAISFWMRGSEMEEGAVHVWEKRWRGRAKRRIGLTAHVFAACQPLLRGDLFWSVRIRAHNYFAKYWAVRTINPEDCADQSGWECVGPCCRVLIRGDVLLSASLSPTLLQMSTRWKEWRKSSTSVAKREEWTARTAPCVILLFSLYSFFFSFLWSLMGQLLYSDQIS